ncbi:MAG TPA: response regulator [Acetobacteraceae bacterium]|nr:response regulator [Acetobacteraceae bacterium]
MKWEIGIAIKTSMEKLRLSQSIASGVAPSSIHGVVPNSSDAIAEDPARVRPGSPFPAARTLIVDDDREMSAMLVEFFRSQGLAAIAVRNREEMARELASREPSMVVLDLRLEREDGLDLLREIRSRGDTPVIIITGHRRDEIDRVVGLELGADDYLTKPFGLRELLARVRAVLRRRDGSRAGSGRERASGGFAFAGWRLNLRSRQLLDAGGAVVPLTKGEFALLTAFLEAPGRPLTREHLLQATRVHEDVFDRSIDVQVLRLRRRLGDDPTAPRIIVTERGIGYRFAIPVERV